MNPLRFPPPYFGSHPPFCDETHDSFGLSKWRGLETVDATSPQAAARLTVDYLWRRAELCCAFIQDFRTIMNNGLFTEVKGGRWALALHHALHRACMHCVWLFGTLWTVARQPPLSMRFSRQEQWSGLPCPPPGDLTDPGIEPSSLMSPTLAGGFFSSFPRRWPQTAPPVFPILPKTFLLMLLRESSAGQLPLPTSCSLSMWIWSKLVSLLVSLPKPLLQSQSNQVCC